MVLLRNGLLPALSANLRIAAALVCAVALSAPNARIASAAEASACEDIVIAYILAGSFVQFLIERYGLPTFQALYETENQMEVYGKSLAALEAEWRSSRGR